MFGCMRERFRDEPLPPSHGKRGAGVKHHVRKGSNTTFRKHFKVEIPEEPYSLSQLFGTCSTATKLIRMLRKGKYNINR